MILGRIVAASRFAATPATFWAKRAGVPQARSMAAVTSPRPLTLRMDSLMVKCTTAALIYFVPQDLVFIAGLVMAWHSKATSISPCKKQADVESAVEAFKAKKGLEDVNVSKGRTWFVTMK